MTISDTTVLKYSTFQEIWHVALTVYDCKKRFSKTSNSNMATRFAQTTLRKIKADLWLTHMRGYYVVCS